MYRQILVLLFVILFANLTLISLPAHSESAAISSLAYIDNTCYKSQTNEKFFDCTFKLYSNEGSTEPVEIQNDVSIFVYEFKQPDDDISCTLLPMTEQDTKEFVGEMGFICSSIPNSYIEKDNYLILASKKRNSLGFALLQCMQINKYVDLKTNIEILTKERNPRTGCLQTYNNSETIIFAEDFGSKSLEEKEDLLLATNTWENPEWLQWFLILPLLLLYTSPLIILISIGFIILSLFTKGLRFKILSIIGFGWTLLIPFLSLVSMFLTQALIFLIQMSFF